jgi:hypothetical protein
MLSSLRRGLGRISALVLISAVFLAAAAWIPELLGPTGAPLAFGFGLCFAGLAVGDVALRILQPYVDAGEAATVAQETPTGAGLVYLGRCILAGVILMLLVTASRAETLPANAALYMPVLKSEQLAHWPGHPAPATLGAQVEQETCASLRSKSCWSPRAELRTSREQGLGLGQMTRAFKKDGSIRFDALGDIKKAYPSQLAGLSWEKPYDPRLQLRALVLKDLQGFESVRGAATAEDRLAMSYAAYNGGLGGLASDRKACAGTRGCDPGRWFGHVERTSLKAKTAVPGYGKSFFEINREYVRNVVFVRTVRYGALK